nr:uncharacterized protein LOC128688839 [Cherax quadricarinatus]
MASSTLPRSKLHQEIQKMCEGLKKIFKALIQYAVEQASSEGEHTHLNEVHTCFLEVLPLILNDFEAESMADMMCQKYGNQELPVNQEKMEWAISFMYEMRQEIERLLDKFILYDHLRSQEKMLLEDSKNVQDPKSPPAYSETDQKAHQASSETDPKCPQTSSGTESKIDLLEDFVRVLKVIIQYLVDLCTSYEREAHVTETLLSLVRDIKAKRITKQVASQSCGSQELPVNTEKTEGGISIM